MKQKSLEKWVKERDAALATLDIEVFKAFYERWRGKGLYTNGEPLPSDEVLEIAIRKMAIAAIHVPKSVKDEARAWLDERGYNHAISF